MKTIFYLLLTIGVWSAHAQTNFNYSRDFETLQAASKQKNNKLNYETLRSRFIKNDATLTEQEVLVLLIGYTALPNYKPSADLFKEGIIYSLNDDSTYQDAIGLSTKYLSSNPVSLKANFAKSQAFKKLKQPDSAAYYDKKWQKILRTMFYSGNGITSKTPIFSLGPDDAKEFIEFYIGAKPTSNNQEKDADGHILQVWEAMLGDKKLKLYFITHHASIRIESDK